jgi:thioredoxin-like negative regulator of GroEL
VTYTVVPNGGEAAAAVGGIRSIPNSFMIDRQGRIVKQFVGLTPREDLEGWVQAVLREKS